jgi:hypothetical protein
MTSLEKLSDSPFCFAHNGAREIERLLAWRQACSALQGLSDSLSHPAAPGRVRRIVDVDQHQARYLFTGRMKLLRHLECDNTPDTMATQVIGAAALDSTNFLNVRARNRPDGCLPHGAPFTPSAWIP